MVVVEDGLRCTIPIFVGFRKLIIFSNYFKILEGLFGLEVQEAKGLVVRDGLNVVSIIQRYKV